MLGACCAVKANKSKLVSCVSLTGLCLTGPGADDAPQLDYLMLLQCFSNPGYLLNPCY